MFWLTDNSGGRDLGKYLATIASLFNIVVICTITTGWVLYRVCQKGPVEPKEALLYLIYIIINTNNNTISKYILC